MKIYLEHHCHQIHPGHGTNNMSGYQRMTWSQPTLNIDQISYMLISPAHPLAKLLISGTNTTTFNTLVWVNSQNEARLRKGETDQVKRK